MYYIYISIGFGGASETDISLKTVNENPISPSRNDWSTHRGNGETTTLREIPKLIFTPTPTLKSSFWGGSKTVHQLRTNL